MPPYMVEFMCVACLNPCAAWNHELTHATCEECGFVHAYGACHKCGELTAIDGIPQDEDC